MLLVLVHEAFFDNIEADSGQLDPVNPQQHVKTGPWKEDFGQVGKCILSFDVKAVEDPFIECVGAFSLCNGHHYIFLGSETNFVGILFQYSDGNTSGVVKDFAGFHFNEHIQQNDSGLQPFEQLCNYSGSEGESKLALGMLHMKFDMFPF